jgi:hypothetical protein
MGGITLALLIPAFFLGVVNLELKDAFVAMFATLPLTLLFTAVARAAPAFWGVVPADVFLFYQFGQVLPSVLSLVPIFVIGLLAGILASEFIFHLD